MSNKSFKILFVDDDVSVLKSIQRLLRKEGLDIDYISEPETALESCMLSNYTMIFCDVYMPDIGGIEFLKQIKRILPDTYMVLMSGRPSVQTAVECMKFGANEYLSKPLKKSEIMGLIQRFQANFKSRNLSERVGSIT